MINILKHNKYISCIYFFFSRIDITTTMWKIKTIFSITLTESLDDCCNIDSESCTNSEITSLWGTYY